MFKGFVCTVSNEPVSPPECLACAANGAPQACSLTAPVVRGMLAHKRPDDFGLSVTTVLGCPRAWRLKIIHDYCTDPRSEWWLYRGQALHAAVEQHAGGEGILAERRLNFLFPLKERMPRAVNDYVSLVGDHVVLTGKPDVVDLERGHIIDYKTTSKVPLRHYTYTCPTTGEVLREGKFPARRDFSCGCGAAHPARDIQEIGPPQARASHRQQLAIYSLMLAENGVPVHTGEIVYQDMKRQKRILVGHAQLEEEKAQVQQDLKAWLPLFAQREIPAAHEVPERVRWMCEKYCPVADPCQQGDAAHVSAQPVEQSLAELGF